MEIEQYFCDCDYLQEGKYNSCVECYRYDICKLAFENRSKASELLYEKRSVKDLIKELDNCMQ